MSDRPTLSKRLRLEIWDRDKGRCAICGEKVASLEAADVDHEPARELMLADPERYPDPDAPEHLRIVHAGDCHKGKTANDVKRYAKHRRTRRKWDEHRERMAAKEPGHAPPRKGTIKSRGFPKRRDMESRT